MRKAPTRVYVCVWLRKFYQKVINFSFSPPHFQVTEETLLSAGNKNHSFRAVQSWMKWAHLNTFFFALPREHHRSWKRACVHSTCGLKGLFVKFWHVDLVFHFQLASTRLLPGSERKLLQGKDWLEIGLPPDTRCHRVVIHHGQDGCFFWGLEGF